MNNNAKKQSMEKVRAGHARNLEKRVRALREDMAREIWKFDALIKQAEALASRGYGGFTVTQAEAINLHTTDYFTNANDGLEQRLKDAGFNVDFKKRLVEPESLEQGKKPERKTNNPTGQGVVLRELVISWET